MNTTNFKKGAGMVALAFTLSAFMVRAADDAPAPAVPPTATATPSPAADPAGGGQQGGRGNRGNIQRGNIGGGVVGGFALDDQQRQLLQEANQVSGDEMRKLNDKLLEAQKELVKVVVAEKYDEKVVREKAEAVAKIQTELTMLRAKAFSTVSPTLKPEQREQLEGNIRIAIVMITGGGFGGGPGGNFAAAGAGGLGGGRNFGGDPAAGGGRNFNGGGPGGDPNAAGGNNFRRGGNTGGNGGAGFGGNAGGGNTRRRGATPDAPTQ